MSRLWLCGRRLRRRLFRHGGMPGTGSPINTDADQRRPYKPTTAARKRLPQRCQARSVPTFLELAPGHFPGVPLGHCECTLELEDADGAKMRVHRKAADTPDLAALSRSFWNPGP